VRIITFFRGFEWLSIVDVTIIADEYADYESIESDAKSISNRRRRVDSNKKRVFVPVFVPEKQKKKSE